VNENPSAISAGARWILPSRSFFIAHDLSGKLPTTMVGRNEISDTQRLRTEAALDECGHLFPGEQRTSDKRGTLRSPTEWERWSRPIGAEENYHEHQRATE
jgi:hypothetical protein